MTPADPLTVLLDRACRGVATPAEAEQLRAAIAQLQQRAAYAERRAEQWEQARDAEVLTTARVFDEYYRRWQSTIVQARRQARRAARYRAAWQSARRRARLIPEAGQEIHDGTRWRPALQAYSVLRARLTRAEQELAALHGQTPQPAEPPTHQADIRVDDDGERNVSCPDCPAYIDNIGDEDDANEWAEQHRAEATSSQAPR